MATITIKNLIGGSINIITGGGGNQDEPVAKTPVWGEGVWHVKKNGVTYKLMYGGDSYGCEDFVLQRDGTLIDFADTNDPPSIDLSLASEQIKKGGTLTIWWTES